VHEGIRQSQTGAHGKGSKGLVRGVQHIVQDTVNRLQSCIPLLTSCAARQPLVALRRTLVCNCYCVASALAGQVVTSFFPATANWACSKCVQIAEHPLGSRRCICTGYHLTTIACLLLRVPTWR